MIDKKLAIPVYIQIKDYFVQEIHSGNLLVGSKFPSENEIVVLSGVSRATVRNGIRLLIEQGYVKVVRGIGTFVANTKMTLDTMSFSSFSRRCAAKGQIISNDIITFKKIKITSNIATHLNIDIDNFVWYIERLRSIENKPVMLEHIWMPVVLFPFLQKEDLLGSRYEWVKKATSCSIIYADRTISAIQAGRVKGKYFNLSPHMPMLFLSSTAFLDNLIPFEFVKIFYHPEYYILSGKLTYSE